VSERMSGSDLAERPATYRSLFADREFRALWLAQTISLTGDQLARVAIAFLVYDRTRSALATALVYAVSYLPWLVGGPLLGGLADRYPRRTVMVACQLASAGLVALMALPDLSTVLLAALLFVVVLVESPFLSARAALLVDVLPDDRYVLASGVGQLTIQGTQVLGFALGGLLLRVLDPSEALLLDAATCLIAAAVVRFAGCGAWCCSPGSRRSGWCRRRSPRRTSGPTRRPRSACCWLPSRSAR
jgi:MFS family permease